jgi:hypothetical protein
MIDRSAVLLCLALLAGCHPVRTCADGTLLLDLTLGSVAASADRIRVDAVVGGQTLHSEVPYTGQPSGSLALDFPRGYPAGQSIALTVTAANGATPLASGSASGTLSGSCARLAIALTGVDGGPAGGGVSVVGFSAAQPQQTAMLSLAMPPGTQAGDFLLLCLYANSSTVTAQLPSGWAPLSELVSPQGFHVWWLTRSADSSLSNAVAGFGGTPLASAVLVAYRGADPSQPIDTHSSPDTLTGSVSGTQIAFTAPSISPARANDRLAAFFVYDSGDGGSWTQPPSGMTKLADTGSIGLFDGKLIGAGATGAATATAGYGGTNGLYGTALVTAIASP